MHATLNPSIKGFYDEFKFGDMNYHKGWCFHDTIGILSLHVKFGNDTIPVVVEERLDVSSFYNEKISMCGWSVKTPNVDCILVALIDGNVVEIFKKSKC